MVRSSLRIRKFVRRIFLTAWLLGWKLSTRGTFPDHWIVCSRSLLRRALSRRRESNLRDILVHSTFASHPEQDQAPPGTFPCNRRRCRTCNYTAKTDTITSTGGSVHLKRRFDCTATGVVYAILCQRCHTLYIGETSRKLADRFAEHLRSVEGYNHNSRYHEGGFPVAEHFNRADHNNT